MAGTSQEMIRSMIEDEVQGLEPEQQALFFRSIANGTSPQMAIGFATNHAPVMKGSDRTLNQTQRRNMNNMNEKNRNNIQKIAGKAGISTQGKFYVGGLGRYNDPAAWVSTYDDAYSVCKARNLTATSIVYHKGTPVPPVRKRMADDIVEDYIGKELAADPKLRESVKKNPGKHLKELKEKVIAEHSKPSLDS